MGSGPGQDGTPGPCNDGMALGGRRHGLGGQKAWTSGAEGPSADEDCVSLSLGFFAHKKGVSVPHKHHWTTKMKLAGAYKSVLCKL